MKKQVVDVPGISSTSSSSASCSRRRSAPAISCSFPHHVARDDRKRVGFARRRRSLGRAGIPEEIAALALYLASPEAAFVNGAAIVIDGGATAR
jgi:NAD(P)-dependent dehydrogenase (short-subunit alcohol dehydrogenase family)